MNVHRVTCDECAKFWREACADCATDRADAHRRETGHAVRLAITAEPPCWRSLGEMMGTARSMLVRRGW